MILFRYVCILLHDSCPLSKPLLNSVKAEFGRRVAFSVHSGALRSWEMRGNARYRVLHEENYPENLGFVKQFGCKSAIS